MDVKWIDPTPHNGSIHVNFPSHCYPSPELCNGGIALAANGEVQIISRYHGDAVFWLDFHGGSKDVFEPNNPPTLNSEQKLFYGT